MPYIPDGDRPKIESGEHEPLTAGELNFAITRLIDQYIEDFDLRYVTLNEVVGVLECVKLELYRRVAAPYEDRKLEENGDVYECLR